MPQYSFFDRDMSWLTFNYRVLEEAAREDTPLQERINFLSIFSSNLDEFYRVRIPALAALQKIKSTRETYVSQEGIKLLTQISSRVNHQLEEFGRLLTHRILPALAAHGIRFVYAEPIPEPVRQTAGEYFFTQILAFLQPVYITRDKAEFFPENDRLYFLIVLNGSEEGEQLVILNIPSDSLPRFYDTTVDDTRYIVFIDDIIRENLAFLFPTATVGGIYSLKVTRDAELDLEDEYEGDIAEKIEKKLARRDAGLATRFLHEPGIPLRSLDILIQRLSLDRASVMTGGRYHNMRDLSGFPVKDRSLSYLPWPGLRPKEEVGPGLLQATFEKDLLLHTPYESYDPVLRFFNEAALDPFVEEIFLTMYRVAKDSRIVHALISACRNGKKVTVFVELKARFDEANNLRWARKMKEAGVRIIYSIPTLKVHAKIGLVKKKAGDRIHYAGLLATGNLNEGTARFYTDHILLTGQHDLMRELELLFIFLCKRKEPRKSEKIAFQHLLVAQFNLQEKFISLIDREIGYARQGSPAHITIKMNNLEEQVLIGKLYEASQAGVRIQLIVRSICCCIPGVKGMSENITIKRIVDRYLEHGRVFIFHNNGQEEIYMGSADWMNRNIYRRIEVCFPVYNPIHKEEIRNIIRLQLADTIAAVPIDASSENRAVDAALSPEGHTFTLPPIEAGVETDGPVRSQESIYRYLAGLRAFCCLLLVLLGLNSCQLISNPLPHLWFYTYATGGGGDADSLLTPASFMELRKDGSYTRDFGQFEYGSWTRKDNQLFLTNQQHKTTTLTVKKLAAEEMQLVLPDGKEGSFEGLSLPSAAPGEDPFSSQNNEWRLPPAHKETDAEIRRRLFNHCQFWEAYFTWALDKQLSTVDVRSTPTSIKIYGNGFGLKPFEELPSRWKAMFFDEEDCRKANDMIGDIFQHKSIAWAHTDSKYKLFISAFQQLKRYLR